MFDKNITAKSLSNIASNINDIIEQFKINSNISELELKILNETGKLYNIADIMSD